MVNNFQKYSNKPFSFYKIPIDLASNRINKIQIEGIYIFGGLNKEKILKNDIYIISIGKKPCHVISPIIADRQKSVLAYFIVGWLCVKY